MNVKTYFRCHLPLLYIGLENGLTNNSVLAEKFFQQAQAIAPFDPFVSHEMGVIAFQSGQWVSSCIKQAVLILMKWILSNFFVADMM